jgi:hypothetical protein
MNGKYLNTENSTHLFMDKKTDKKSSKTKIYKFLAILFSLMLFLLMFPIRKYVMGWIFQILETQPPFIKSFFGPIITHFMIISVLLILAYLLWYGWYEYAKTFKEPSIVSIRNFFKILLTIFISGFIIMPLLYISLSSYWKGPSGLEVDFLTLYSYALFVSIPLLFTGRFLMKMGDKDAAETFYTILFSFLIIEFMMGWFHFLSLDVLIGKFLQFISNNLNPSDVLKTIIDAILLILLSEGLIQIVTRVKEKCG